MLRDERAPRIERIHTLGREVVRCIEAKAYDAALAMQFIELDMWAFLTRPASMTIHGRASFMWFIKQYLQDAPGQGYSYSPGDVYAARCALLHTFGSLSNMHATDKSVVVWRFHLGKLNTLVPGLDRMAYISVMRFIKDARAATSASLQAVMADGGMNKLLGERLVQVYFHAGVLPSRDPDAVATMDTGIDADIAVLDGTIDSDEPIFLAGHTSVRGVCRC
jgi:hypothetical protein